MIEWMRSGRHERFPVGRARQAGIDEGGAAIVVEDVAVHMPETGHGHRQLQPAHVRREFSDLAVRRHLLLASRV